jgi:hypothetical protein
MADIFDAYSKRLESPLDSIEIAPDTHPTQGYNFTQKPRALNCSQDGTLRVSMNGVTGSIAVIQGLNPYRVDALLSGSSTISVVGMY